MPNILIVEDDAMIRDILARHLKWEGYQIITAVNGVQAVALAQSEPIDLILMDIGLPIMNEWMAGDAPTESGAGNTSHPDYRSNGLCTD